MVNKDLRTVTAILADWVDPAPSYRVYLFGSRVRGDHRSTSDVDIVLDRLGALIEDVNWWFEQRETDFAAVRTLLPGSLRILHPDEKRQRTQVLKAPVIYADRKVTCVWLEPKPPGLAVWQP